MSGYIGRAPLSEAIQSRAKYTVPAAGQTSFSFSYQPGFIDVFLNGIKLEDTVDYTATNGSDIILTLAATSGQIFEAVGLTTFSLIQGKQNYNATTAPAVTDDSADGYRKGSMWIDTVTDDIYRCTDDTVGAAVWIGTTLEVTDLGALATKSTIGTTDIDNGAVTATKLAAGAAVPTQTGQTGKFLKTDGTTATWATVDQTIAGTTGLQAALDAKVDDTQVLTNVPSGAVFTDTETTTTLSIAANVLKYTDEVGAVTNLDLSLYLDDTNLAYIASGALNGSTGIATFTRSDASTFTVDLSALLDDTKVTVNNTLTSTSTTEALSAAQGKALNTRVLLNDAKTGITSAQASAITANTAKVSNVAHPLVETAVPVGALFTDTNTVYSHPATHPASMLTGALPAIDGSNLTGIDAATVSATAPTSPAAGDMWFDSTTGTTAMKVWSGSGWDQMSNKFSATGGTESTYSSGGTNYKVHTFTSSGAFTPTAAGSVDYLVIGGGGGGGAAHAGAGGAGGYRTSTAFTLSATSYSITVGGGGAGAASNATRGANGANSVFSTITSTGGGGGGSRDDSGNSNPQDGAAGGSGGGGAGADNGPKVGGAGTSGQGNAGGSGAGGGTEATGGGGGGAAGTGPNATSGVAGAGGGGNSSSINGTAVTRAGGGGGGAYTGRTRGLGGSGGGGNGSSSVLGSNGSANYGGGGGGGSSSAAAHNAGHNGGSGIVIIRYAI